MRHSSNVSPRHRVHPPPARRGHRLAAALSAFAAVCCAHPAHGFASWQRERFTIVGFEIGVPSDTSRYTKLNNAGLDILMQGHEPTLATAELIAENLDELSARYRGFHLGTMMHYIYAQHPKYRDDAFTHNAVAPQSVDKINGTLCRPGVMRPSVRGFWIWDEPCARAGCRHPNGEEGDCFADIDAISQVIDTSSCAAGRMPYVNLMPIHGFGPNSHCAGDSCVGTEVDTYRCYLDQYLSLFDGRGHAPPVLSVDHYPLQVRSTASHTYRTYCEGLKVMRDKAAQYSTAAEPVPMWMIVQLSGWEPAGHDPYAAPSTNEIRWQAYLALAYGAKGIGYWTLVRLPVGPGGVEGAFGDGILDTLGRPTERYTGVQRLNAELHALGPTLMALDPIAAYHMSPLGQQGIDGDTLAANPDPVRRPYGVVASMTEASGARDGMVGCFKRRATDDDYLMVVNQSTTTPRSYTIRLAAPADTIRRVSKTRPRTELVVGTRAAAFTVSRLAPGTGELYHIVGVREPATPAEKVAAPGH